MDTEVKKTELDNPNNSTPRYRSETTAPMLDTKQILECANFAYN
jgi:hypothetical protein